MPSQESKFKFCFQTLKYIIEHIYTRYLVQKMLELPTKTPKKKPPKRTPKLQLWTLRPLLLLLLISQQPPQNLAARALGNHIDKLYSTFQPLVFSLVLLYMLENSCNNFLIRNARRFPCLGDIRLGHLACAIVGDWDDGAVGDKLMGEKVGFQFGWSDLVALLFQSAQSYHETRKFWLSKRHTLTLMSSLIRSTTTKCSCPFAEFRTTTSSPVLSHLPSSCQTKVSAFAFSLLRYPSTTAGDCTRSSPLVSCSVTSFPSESMILTRDPGTADPAEPSRMSSSLVVETTGEHSVMPKLSIYSQKTYWHTMLESLATGGRTHHNPVQYASGDTFS